MQKAATTATPQRPPRLSEAPEKMRSARSMEETFSPSTSQSANNFVDISDFADFKWPSPGRDQSSQVSEYDQLLNK